MSSIRTPAVAGTFYPGEGESLSAMLASLTARGGGGERAMGIVAPHAGYVYSGGVAGEVYSRLDLPARYIILCPNHTGMGRPLALNTGGAWETPLGTVPVDEEIAQALVSRFDALEDDSDAHRSEHALEVQLPFLQFLRSDGFRFVPIAVGTSNLESLRRLGDAMAEVVDALEEPVLIIASSDMNHYEADAVTRRKDHRAIRMLLERDPAGLYETVIGEDISMCGFAPATAMLFAVNRLGARRAELVSYRTSGDAFGDRERVVGYAGVVVS